jgi:hypothetical protein
MQNIIVTICVAFLLSIDPAVARVIAQKEYPLKVSVHEDVRPKLTAPEVNQILRRASTLLKVRNGCPVKFKLDGPIKSFAPGTPKNISNEDELEAVHREAGDVKVVGHITFCRKQAAAGDDFIGCGWRRNGVPTVIVTQKLLAIRHILWTHEFGHTTGLKHRADSGALMTPCKLFPTFVEINPTECGCFRAGPGGCPIPEPDPEIVCPDRR